MNARTLAGVQAQLGTPRFDYTTIVVFRNGDRAVGPKTTLSAALEIVDAELHTDDVQYVIVESEVNGRIVREIHARNAADFPTQR